MLSTPVKHTVIVCSFLLLSGLGCGPSYTALAPGNPMPDLENVQWLDGNSPNELIGKVIVVEAFATW